MSGSEAGDRTHYRIELARPACVARLPAIEVAAAELFPPEDLAPELRTEGLAVEVFERAAREGRLWIAIADGGDPVGFALATTVDGSAHLYEMDVHPDHGRQGLGTALVEAVVRWARQSGFPSITLTTFGHLPWNAPFYRRLGFAVLADAELTQGLARQLDSEAEAGLDRSKRVAMRLDLTSPVDPRSIRPGPL